MIIKKLLHENKKAWHTKLIFTLWVDIITTKRSIGTSPFQTVYGTEVAFPPSLGLPVMILLREQEEEPNHMQRRINQLMEVQEKRGKVYDESLLFQEKLKKVFDRRTKADDF